MILRKIKYSLTDVVLILIFILIVASTSPLCVNTLFKNVLLFSLLFFSYYTRKKIDYILLIICCYFFIVDMASSIYLSNITFNFFAEYTYIYPIVFSYCIITIIGKDILNKVENIVFILALISLPLFTIQIFFTTWFESLVTIFGDYVQDGLQRGYSWYAFIFNYARPIEDDLLQRNSGFMWEPGAYALVLVAFFIIRLNKVGLNLKDRHLIVYLIALFTTLSTSGYLASLCLLVPFVLNQKSTIIKYILFIILIIIVPYLFSLEFMSEKIISYVDDANSFTYGFHEDMKTIEFNRYMFLIYVLQYIVEFPLGYGTNPVTFLNYTVIAPNGLAQILFHWGVIGVFFIVVSLYKFVSQSSVSKRNVLSNILLTFALLILMFSNPIHFNPIIFLIILYPYISFKNSYLNIKYPRYESCCHK